MKKCECYFEEEHPMSQYGNFTSGYSRTTGLTTTIGYCNGTKERDVCNCKGDRCKCDFYPEIRAKANKEYKEVSKNTLEKDFVKSCEKCKTPEDILNWYRNIYYKENQGTEHRIVAEAINEFFVYKLPKMLEEVRNEK